MNEQKLVDAFTAAALHLKDKVQKENWTWTSNYLREYVRARFHYKFSNTYSPTIMRKVVEQHPELKAWVTLHELKRHDDD